MAAELTRRFAAPHDVRATLTEAIAVLEQLKVRLGRYLFKDFVGLHFSSTAPCKTGDRHSLVAFATLHFWLSLSIHFRFWRHDS